MSYDDLGETLFLPVLVCHTMATSALDVDLSVIRDPQRPVALVVGLVLVVLGLAGLSGVLDGDLLGLGMGLGDGLLLGVFGIPLWLGVTAVVAGLLGVYLSTFAGGATTFNKVAAGLVLPAVLLLAVVDWALALGGVAVLVVAAIALLAAVGLVLVGTVLLNHHVLVVVLPVVAVLAIADWAFALTDLAPAGAAANPPTLGLLLVLAVLVGAIGFEGGRRLT